MQSGSGRHLFIDLDVAGVSSEEKTERKQRLQVRFPPPGAGAPPTTRQRLPGSRPHLPSSRLGGGLQNSLATSPVGGLKSCSSLRTTDLEAKPTAKESGQTVAELVTAVSGRAGASTGHHRCTHSTRASSVLLSGVGVAQGRGPRPRASGAPSASAAAPSASATAQLRLTSSGVRFSMVPKRSGTAGLRGSVNPHEAKEEATSFSLQTRVLV